MASLQRIKTGNHNKYNYDGENAYPVKAGFWNTLITLLEKVITESATLTVDTIAEQTAEAGVTVDGVALKDGEVGGVSILSGKVGATNDISANATGVGAAIISAAEQHVVITSSSADHIIALPLLASLQIGSLISGSFVNTGCELRPHPTDRVTAVTVNNVSATGGTETAFDNSTGGAYFEAVKTKATSWILKSWSKTGAYRAMVPD